MSAAEASLLRKTGRKYDLSEMSLAYGLYHTNTDPLGWTNGDTVYAPFGTGGNLYLSMFGLSGWDVGLTTEKNLPYAASSALAE